MLSLLLLFESPALSGIMPALDVVEDIRSRFGSRPVLPPVHPFPFEAATETLGRGIVGTTAHRTHAADHLIGSQKLLVLFRGKLAAPI